jgi:hypothetical protein
VPGLEAQAFGRAASLVGQRGAIRRCEGRSRVDFLEVRGVVPALLVEAGEKLLRRRE